MTLDIWSQAVLLGAWFGLLHAFDADHLATIGGLAYLVTTQTKLAVDAA